MKKVLVDKDLLIDFSKGRGHMLQELLGQQDKGKVSLFVNPVIVAEYMTDENLGNKDKVKVALEFLGQFGHQEINKRMGILAGQLLRNREVQFMGDALIAAGCLVGECHLATGNKKHFMKVKGLDMD